VSRLITVLAVVLALSVVNSASAERTHRTIDNRSAATTLKLRATLYSIALETDYPNAKDGAFMARDSSVLHRASRAFVADASIQGSARLKDGRMLMIDGRDEGATHWKVSPHRYAIGALGCRLLAFRSAAVDKNVIPLGSKLIIPETRGMVLPDGTEHDGVWYAVDTGGDIKHGRIDLFVGAGKAPLAIPIRHGIGHLEALEVRLGGAMQGCPTA
jgi:3D (Asp-Asp-Asp) domain-containing protein